MLASVALRTSIGSRRSTVQLQKVEGIQEGLGLAPAMAEQLKGGHAFLVAIHDLAVDQAGPHLEVVHSLGHQRVAARPVVPPAGNQPDAHGVATGHKPKPIVLDLVNPVGAGRRLVGWGWEAGFDEARPFRGQALTHTLDQHAANLGNRSGESNRNAPP
jgi:hypothetical protein